MKGLMVVELPQEPGDGNDIDDGVLDDEAPCCKSGFMDAARIRRVAVPAYAVEQGDHDGKELDELLRVVNALHVHALPSLNASSHARRAASSSRQSKRCVM